MTEQPEDPTGVSLAFVAVDDQAGHLAKLEGGPVTGLGENHVLCAIEDLDGGVIADSIRRLAENDQEALLICLVDHRLPEYQVGAVARP